MVALIAGILGGLIIAICIVCFVIYYKKSKKKK